jgi:IclR family acetate operon transcriptional repressor
MEQDIKFKRIQSVDRALDIMTIVSESHGLTMNEIAKLMGLKPGTVYNIVKTLSSRGFLSNVEGRFEVGSALGMAASRWDIERSLPQMAKPLLRELNQVTGEVTCITILAEENRAEMITLQPSDHACNYRYTHSIWDYPLYLATGRVLAAFGPETCWNSLIKAHLKSNMITEQEKDWDYQRWQDELNNIKKQGYTIISPRMEQSGQVSAIGVPMFKPNGELLASVGVSCVKERTSPEHLIAMKDAALSLVKRNPLWGVREENVC